MVNCRVGEVYIIGIQKGHKKKTKLIQVFTKKGGKIRYINMINSQYLDAREISSGERFHSFLLKNLEDIRFVFWVTKKWPEINQNQNNIKFLNV